MAESVASETPKLRADLTFQTLKIFWRHTRVYWPMLILCAAGMLAAIGADMVSPLIRKHFIDLLAIDPIHRMARGNLGSIYQTVVLIGLVMAVSWLGWRGCSIALMKLESRVMKDLSDFCFEYMQNHSYRFFSDNFQGSLVKRVNRFAAGFEVIADQCAMNAGQTAIRIVCIIVILFWRNTTLGWVFLAWTATFVCFNYFFARWKLKYDLARAELDTKVTARLSDTISNSINLKLFAGIERETAQFKELTDRHRNARYTSWKLSWNSESIQGASIRMLELVVFVIAIRYWIRGTLTVGDFFLLSSYLYQLTEEVRSLGGYIRRIYEAMADANEMTEILVMPHEIRDVASARPLVVKNGVLEFRDVSFAYVGGGNPVLRNFSLKTNRGERVGIVGPSGGGKSTILKLMDRLYDVTDGQILIDDQNIASMTQNSLRARIAFVPQEPILFHRSLMENIRYSRPDATDRDVIRAAELAHCHEFISGFPDGYETLVGERGIKLSGGQRQRVAIARAILMDAPILVLDEATNSLDSESEMLVQDALAKLVVGRTVIAVAHRLSTIRTMDRIVVVKDGQIIEQGSHNLLLKLKNGLYRRLWGLQSSDFVPDASNENVFETAGYVQ